MSVFDNLYHYKFRVDRCIDGDTVEGKLDKGRKNFDEDVRIRLLDIQAPETRTLDLEEKARGYEAKAFLEDLVLGQWVLVKTYKIKDDDNFGRMLGDIWIDRDGIEIHVNSFMIEAGHAVPWEG
jgi:endonuclease YncB( thermonuclease family)